MIRLAQILIATDFSEPSQAAFRYGRELARMFNATLHVLHVVDDIAARHAEPYAAARLPPGLQADFDNAAQVQLERLLDEDDRRDLHARAVLRTSTSPTRGIVDYARDSGIDLIVMGRHSRKALDRVLLGSVADRVLRTAPCPVLIVTSCWYEAPVSEERTKVGNEPSHN